jgi:hypothetical protein
MLIACIMIWQNVGKSHIRGFVYPRNIEKHIEQLASNGFRIFREPDNTWYHRLPGVLRRIGHVVDAYCWPYTPIGTLHRRDGMLGIPGNQFFTHRTGWARFLPISFQVRKARNGLRRAVRERKIFHFWTHPENIATDSYALLSGFRKVCALAAQLRDDGVLENMTMGQVSHRYG